MRARLFLVRLAVLAFFFFAGSAGVWAEVVRLPPLSLPYEFSRQPEFLSGAQSWADYRWYTDRDAKEDFGTDFDLGVAADLYSSPRVAVRGLVRMLYQARHLEEFDNPLAFSPRNLLTDLRFLTAYNADPVVLYGGWRHDCTHEVDEDSTRRPIHDTLVAGLEYEMPEISWKQSGIHSSAEAQLEAELNVPSLFVESAAFIDRGRVTGGLRVEPIVHESYGALFLHGRASLIFRETEGINVRGIEARNVDWNLAAGYRVPGAAGSLSLYYRVERLTDPWYERNVDPVLLSAVGAVLHMK